MSSSSNRTFPTIKDPRRRQHFDGEEMEEGELMKEELTNISFYDCPDDFDFLKLLELETLPRLEERFDWLKLKFRILNAKCFNRQSEGGSFFNNFLFTDVRYYPCLLSWHFEDCVYVNFSTMMMKIKNYYKNKNNQDSDDDDDDDNKDGESSPFCTCGFGLKDPDEKIKRNARELNIEENWCMDGTLLNISRIKNEYFAMYRSGCSDRAIRDRYFGYGFNSGDESQFSEEMRGWSLRRLRCMRSHIASRLRLVNFVKTIRKYNLPEDFYGLKIMNGKWHVNCCLNTNQEQNCVCSLAFDHPKGWLRYFCNVTNIGKTGYALLQKPIFRDLHDMY